LLFVVAARNTRGKQQKQHKQQKQQQLLKQK